MANKIRELKEISLKELYNEIYDNALDDRDKAAALFASLDEQLSDAEDHALNGPTIAKYLERLNKSNDQLIKILEIKQRAQLEDSKRKAVSLSETDKDELFATINESLNHNDDK